MNVSVTEIKIRIDIDFPDCDVDMMLRETMGSPGQGMIPPPLYAGAKIAVDPTKLPSTPTMASVDYCLSYLSGCVDLRTGEVWGGRAFDAYRYKGLENLGFEVEYTYGLCQGQCHLVLTIPKADYTLQKEKAAMAEVERVFTKCIRYYNENFLNEEE